MPGFLALKSATSSPNAFCEISSEWYELIINSSDTLPSFTPFAKRQSAVKKTASDTEHSFFIFFLLITQNKAEGLYTQGTKVPYFAGI